MSRPAYLAVIFSSELKGKDPEYERAAARMVELASTMPGFLGIEDYQNGCRGVTISYWQSEEAIQKWREHPEHLEAQARGRSEWYRRFTLRVTRIVREYEFDSDTPQR